MAQASLLSASPATSLLASRALAQSSHVRPRQCSLPTSLQSARAFLSGKVLKDKQVVPSLGLGRAQQRKRAATRAVQEASSASPRANKKEVVPDTEVSITKVSFGTIGLVLGLFLLSFGFGAYFQFLPGGDISPLALTYGFPLTLIGFALKYAELKPVECISYADAVAKREQATPILAQVRSDVTRYRYGDEQHLDVALERIFRYGQAGGVPRRYGPVLVRIREEVENGRYGLVLVFEAKELKLSDFTDRQAKFQSFFGPGITAAIEDGGNSIFEVRLITTGEQVPVPTAS